MGPKVKEIIAIYQLIIPNNFGCMGNIDFVSVMHL